MSFMTLETHALKPVLLAAQ